MIKLDWCGKCFIRNIHVLRACQKLEKSGGNGKQVKNASEAMNHIEALLNSQTEKTLRVRFMQQVECSVLQPY